MCKTLRIFSFRSLCLEQLMESTWKDHIFNDVKVKAKRFYFYFCHFAIWALDNLYILHIFFHVKKNCNLRVTSTPAFCCQSYLVSMNRTLFNAPLPSINSASAQFWKFNTCWILQWTLLWIRFYYWQYSKYDS